ncbi:hypothetical protein [Salinibacterium sp. TMP30]|uniref:hypothetical protein n=1 Tax=Salinibacterium sp. TMP30 TaxID=3138237 RepID=UPI003138FE89
MPSQRLPVLQDVVSFIIGYFDEYAEEAPDVAPESVAWRVRRRRYGWQIDTQPSSGELLLGPGPLIVDGRTGDYWRTSSSPVDVFGEPGVLGWSQLTSRRLFEQWRRERGLPDGNILRGATHIE